MLLYIMRCHEVFGSQIGSPNIRYTLQTRAAVPDWAQPPWWPQGPAWLDRAASLRFEKRASSGKHLHRK